MSPSSEWLYHLYRIKAGVLCWQATAALLMQVAMDQEAAEEVSGTVGREEVQVKAKAAQTQALAEEAKADLDQAMPALNAAVESLSALNKGDIVEIKSMLKPPPLVQMTMEVMHHWGSSS